MFVVVVVVDVVAAVAIAVAVVVVVRLQKQISGLSGSTLSVFAILATGYCSLFGFVQEIYPHKTTASQDN